MKRILLSWSSGKDCAWALHVLRQKSDVKVVELLTTLNTQFDRVAMHGTRRAVLEAQADAAGLPLWTVPLPWPCSNEIYESQQTRVRAPGARTSMQSHLAICSLLTCAPIASGSWQAPGWSRSSPSGRSRLTNWPAR